MSGGITVSPWMFRCMDKANVPFTAAFNFDTTTRALTSCTITRSAGCMYANLWLGKGGDGKPNSTTMVYAAPGTSTTVTSAQLAAQGLSTIDNVLAVQITCG